MRFLKNVGNDENVMKYECCWSHFGHSRVGRGLCWLMGIQTPRSAQPALDDLEPYCDEATLVGRRKAATVSVGEDRAMRKIGARYGAEL